MDEYTQEEISNEENYRRGYMRGFSAAAGEIIHQILSGTATSPHDLLRSLQREKSYLSKWSRRSVRTDIADGLGLWGWTYEDQEAGEKPSSGEIVELRRADPTADRTNTVLKEPY